MITYDWKTVWNKSEGKASKILDIVSYLTYKDIPDNIYDPIMRYVDTDWDGISFLLNPEAIVQWRMKKYEKDLAEYVALASFRSLAEYKITKRTTLSLMESPLVPETIDNNKFLAIDNDVIRFRWEESTIH